MRPRLGRPLLRAVAVDSTMAWARAEVEAGRVGPGAVLVAGEQTAGRGRHGRRWVSPPGKGLYLTAVLPADLARPSVTLAAAVAAAEAGEEVAGVEVRIKWPNDVLVDGRKWGGVLAEPLPPAGGAPVLLGIGLNVGHAGHDLGPELAGSATSLATACGRAVDPEELLRVLLPRLEARLAAFARDGFAAVAAAYGRRAAFVPGDVLELAGGDGPPRVVVFRGLDGEGRLLVEGEPRPLASAAVLGVRRKEGR